MASVVIVDVKPTERTPHLIHSFLSKPGYLQNPSPGSKAYLLRYILDKIWMAYRAMPVPSLPRRDLGCIAYQWAGKKPPKKLASRRPRTTKGITTTLHGLILRHKFPVPRESRMGISYSLEYYGQAYWHIIHWFVFSHAAKSVYKKVPRWYPVTHT